MVALTYEKVIDVPTDLKNCSIPDFVKLFDFLEQKRFGNKFICWGGKKDCGGNSTHTTSFHYANKESLITFCFPDTHP